MLVPGESGARVPTTRNGIGVVSMGTLVPEPFAVEFDSVTAGSSQTWRATKEFTVLRELLAGMEWGKLDYLLVDLPPGVERIVQYAELLGPQALAGGAHYLVIGRPITQAADPAAALAAIDAELSASRSRGGSP